jgi:hypothetical protein
MEWVASTLHTTSEHGVSSITTADALTSATSSRLNLSPCRFKWTRPFRRKTKSGFCACVITFQTHFTELNSIAEYTRGGQPDELMKPHLEAKAGMNCAITKQCSLHSTLFCYSLTSYFCSSSYKRLVAVWSESSFFRKYFRTRFMVNLGRM